MQELVKEVNAIAPTKENKVSEEHPELHHYTTRVGLKGIYESQSLWATVFDVMNDPGEFVYAKGFYVDALARQIKPHLIERKRASLKFDRKLKALGGTIADVAREQARILVETYYDVSMFAGAHRGDKVRFCRPHIASFCSHNQDKAYEQRNGLLSQWRGYGGAAGFAIVFDTLKLEKMLEMEGERFDYVTIRFFDVQYDGDPRGVKENFTYLVELMAKAWVASIDGEKSDVGEHFALFLQTAPRLKHRAFFEEREVRIVVYPVFQEFRDYCFRHQVENTGRAIKQLETTAAKPHLSLFEGSGDTLPMKRIIVGPSKEQKQAADWVRGFVKNKIEVCLSETPFRAD